MKTTALDVGWQEAEKHPWVLFASPLLWVESKNSPGIVGWWCWTAVLAATVGSLSGCAFGFLSCFAGPPGALALALYLMFALYVGL